MIFAAFGETVENTNEKVHRAGGRDNNNLFELSVFNNAFDLGIAHVNDEHDFGMGAIDVIFDFFFRRKRVNHVGDSTNFIDGIKHVDFFWRVGHTNGDTVAFFDAEIFKSSGDAVDFFNHFVIGNFVIIISDGGVAGPFTA